ncbi:NAD-P-binding protein [Trametes versicolor FP-101664 SS1]|uniref:NAD-P-binding protein n=1 Tax=Trametes versicolor (strain FP-101664) TaxID=717944 RepID=R7S7Z6_TRAVS|nr:NAD-P-binding protein [Trametes versicolor FP-101664 SS1]EIW52126.1 NAD-P-binding protein [Trametes versicolor FP-101664 SS1]
MASWGQHAQGEWSVDDMPDQTGKVFLITGGNTGLGKLSQSRAALLRRNAKVYITSRDRERGQQALERLRRISETIHVLPLDLSDLHSVRRAALEFMRREKYLHVLINNAGVMCTPAALLTHQCYDFQFGVNALGHFYLTHLLLPVLLTTASAVARALDKVRVVHYTCTLPLSSRVDYTTLMDGPVRRKRTPGQLYQQSKLADLLLAVELADQYADQGIVSIAVNPGNTFTELTRHTKGVGTAIWNMLSHDVSKGIISPLFAATAPIVLDMNGKLLGPRARVQDIPTSMMERCAGETLWDWLAAQTECFEIVNGIGPIFRFHKESVLPMRNGSVT